MQLFENGLNLFGIQIVPTKDKIELTPAIAPEKDEDGAILTSSSGAAYNGFFLDLDGIAKDDIQSILKYREISLYPEIDIAIQDIVNEAIPQEDDSKQVSLNLDDLEFSDKLTEKIQQEFDHILSLLNYKYTSADLFRKWYVDGRLAFQVITDKNNPKAGIIELRQLDATKIRKVKEIKKDITPSGAPNISTVEEYYVYNEASFGNAQSDNRNGVSVGSQGIRIAADSIVFVPSGYNDQTTGMVLSYLQKAIRPANMLRMLEDATVVYFIARAPERRVFYVDVGSLPKLKAEQYLKDIMNRYRNKMVYDAKTGDVRNDKRYASMVEDFWMPRREGGKGTEITTLQGASNITGFLDSLGYFKKKLYEALNIPVGRLEAEGGFNLGRSTEISRDELKFQKFIDRLRMKFSVLLLESMRIHLTMKGICNTAQWENIRQNIKIEFQRDNYFSELKNQEILSERMNLLQQADNYLLKYFSKNWVQKNILQFSQDEIDRMDAEMQSEISDASAAPSYTDPMTGMTTDPTMTGQTGQQSLTQISPAAATKGGQAEIAPPQPQQQ